MLWDLIWSYPSCMLTPLIFLKTSWPLLIHGWNRRHLSLKSNNLNTYRTDRSPRGEGGVQIAVSSTLTYQRIYFLNPNDKEFVGVKVSLQYFSIFVTCYYYIPPGPDLIIYEHHLSAIRTVLSHLTDRNLLIVLVNFNLPDISWSDLLLSTPLSVHDYSK